MDDEGVAQGRKVVHQEEAECMSFLYVWKWPFLIYSPLSMHLVSYLLELRCPQFLFGVFSCFVAQIEVSQPKVLMIRENPASISFDHIPQ